MKCKVCGKEENTFRYYGEEVMREHQMCFTCNFWREHLEEDKKLQPYTAVVIDGTHYYICREDSKSYFRGFGGARFNIRFNDGYLVTTTNLWCQGNIPSEWRDKFPDNAKFEENLKWKEIGGTEYLVKE